MEAWYSPRHQAEQLRRDRAKVFDEFLDLALDGVVTLEQAAIGIEEIKATEAEIEAV